MNAKAPPEFNQEPVMPVATRDPDVTALPPPPSLKHPPYAATSTIGGSVRGGPSSKKAGTRLPKKNATDLALEQALAEYEESRQRMQREGVSFAEC